MYYDFSTFLKSWSKHFQSAIQFAYGADKKKTCKERNNIS